MIRIVYILGSGRSGSTLLDISLGSAAYAQSVGELAYLPLRANDPRQPCSCGRPLRACTLWSKVLAECEREFTLLEYETAQRQFEAYRRLPQTLWYRFRQRESLERYLSMLGILIRTTAKTAGKRVLVESSKSPLRGLIYSWLDPSEFDVRYVHIVRDGRNSLTAFKVWTEGGAFDPSAEIDSTLYTATPTISTPAYHYAPWLTSVWWTASNLMGSLLRWKDSERVCFLRYEDFVDSPSASLEAVGDFLDLDLSQVVKRVKSREALVPSHLMAGNRIRFLKEVRLRATRNPPKESKDDLPWHFYFFASILNRLYGYHHSP